MVFVEFSLLLISLVLLVICSDRLVDAGEKIAKKIGISDFVLGLTIIAVGTTLPEMATGIVASAQSDFALNWGNIIGSCIANIGFVLALSILVTDQFDIRQKFFKPDLLAMMGFTILFIAFGSNGVFSPFEGAILVLLFLAYIFWLSTSIQHAGQRDIKQEFKQEAKLNVADVSNPWDFALRTIGQYPTATLVLSLIGIWLGAHGTVEYSSRLADAFGISQTIIGFSVVSIGTSLPNILVALSALNHKLGDVFLGSIIGANIATIAMVGGVSAIINPMTIGFAGATVAYGFLVMITALLFFAAWLHPTITKKTAFLFMAIWLAFLALSFNQAGV